MTTDDAISKLKNLRVAVINDNPLGSLHGMYEALNMAIEALKREKWIPVSERLPKKYGYYLVTVSTCSEYDIPVKVAYWSTHRWSEKHAGEKVIAWRPLPEPYKEPEK